MNRKIFVAFFLLLFLSGIIFFLFQFRKTRRPVGNAIRAIPTSSLFIIETRQTHESWKKLSETNIIWEELLNVKFVNKLDSQIRIFDSLYLLKPEVKEIFNDQSLFISAHMTDEKNFNFLFLFKVPPSVGSSAIFDLSEEIFGRVTHSEKEYDRAIINTFQSENGNFYFSVFDDIFIGSFNAMLVEDAVRQINTGTSLLDDFAFNKVSSTSSGKSDGNLFINHKYFPQFIATFTKKEYGSTLLSLKNFADWTALDLKIKPNILMLNGFTFSNDTLNKFLSFFKQQKPQEAGFTEIIPSNTADFVHFGFSNFNSFYKEYNLYLDNNGREEKINNINKECSCDIEKNMLSWVENEMAIIFTDLVLQGNNSAHKSGEEPGDNLSGNYYAVFKSGNIAGAKQLLDLISDSTGRNRSDSTALSEYEIKKLRFSGIHPLLLGGLFSGFRSEYFTIIDDYVVFGREKQPLLDFISGYISGKTLSKKLYYSSFSENLSSESNIYIFSNINRSFNIFRQFANPENLKYLEESKDLFHKFEAVAVQLSNENNNLFYNNIYLKYNPAYKQEISTIWETRLDTNLNSGPFLVSNHYTQAKEIFVQDNANNIYLISGTGKILWKRQIEEKMIGGVHQVDALKNNKLQMLFNSTSFVYLVDRNGKDVTGFPVKLKAPATNEIAVFDYMKDKNYRLVIACNDNKVYNYEISGQPVKGWEIPKLKSPVKEPFSFFSLEGKDFLVGVDEEGNIYMLDRSGKSRMNIKGRLPLSKNNGFFIEPGKNIAKTRIVATDSSGKIMRLYLNGNSENIKIDDFSSQHFFEFRDINSDKSAEYIFVDKNELRVFSQEKLRYSIFDYRFEGNITRKPEFYEFPDKSIRIGVVDRQSNQLFLFNETGTVPEDFPLYGTTLFRIGNINNDGEQYLVTGSGNNIYAYLLN